MVARANQGPPGSDRLDSTTSASQPLTGLCAEELLPEADQRRDRRLLGHAQGRDRVVKSLILPNLICDIFILCRCGPILGLTDCKYLFSCLSLHVIVFIV